MWASSLPTTTSMCWPSTTTCAFVRSTEEGINKAIFVAFVTEAREKAFTMQNSCHAFEAYGIWPLCVGKVWGRILLEAVSRCNTMGLIPTLGKTKNICRMIMAAEKRQVPSLWVLITLWTSPTTFYNLHLSTFITVPNFTCEEYSTRNWPSARDWSCTTRAVSGAVMLLSTRSFSQEPNQPPQAVWATDSHLCPAYWTTRYPTHKRCW